MYYYLVDNSKRKEFDKIEQKATEILVSFDILGEFDFIDNLADVEDKVKGAIDKGFSTIVAVGGEVLANKVAINLVNSKIALGILPLEDSLLVNSLGLGNWKNSLEILAARRVLLMDTGVINNKFFITELLANQSPDMPPEIKQQSIFSKLLSSKPKIDEDKKNQITVNVRDQYQVEATISGLVVTNLRPFGNNIESIRQSMIDECLHLGFSDQLGSGDVLFSLNSNVKEMQSKNISLFHLQEFEIRSEKPLFFWSNNEVIARTPAELSVERKSLKVISGRLR